MFQHLEHRLGHYLLLSLVWAALCLPNLGGPSLWDVDEGHNAEAAREMLVAGNVVVPTFNYRWRHDKPALLYWLQMGSYQLFGVSEWSSRFPSALAALGVIVIAYEFGRRMFSAATGLLAGVILATSVMFCAAARFANPDALLLFATSLTLLIFWNGYASGGRWWFVGAGAAAGLAVLAKGPVGVALPGAVVLLFLLWSRSLRILWDWRLPLGILAATAVALPWYAAVTAETKGAFVREFLLKHNAGRFGGVMEGHGGPWFYYLLCLIVGLAPWSVFLGPSVFYALGSHARADVDNNHTAHARPYRFLWCWVMVYLIFFSASATKLPNYILPIYLPVSLIMARFLDRWRRGSLMAPAWILNVCLACLALVGVGVAAGLLLAGGVVDSSFLRGRKLPGVEVWALVGAVPLAFAVVGWWCIRQRRRTEFVAGFAFSAALLIGIMAAGGAAAVDAHKAARPLAKLLPPDLNRRDVRIGCYGYYQPSLVYYCRREVTKLETQAGTEEFLRHPMQVYLFVPTEIWRLISSNAHVPFHVLGAHTDLYLGQEIVLVTNRLDPT